MVDNFSKLKSLMDFSDEEKFYYLQILARSKDGHNKATKVVKNYFIQNEEYFDSHEDQIKEICDFFGARAYLRLNRRNYKDVAWENFDQMTNLMRYGQYKAVMSSFSKACGRTNDEDNKVWIIDIDEEDYGDWSMDIVNDIKLTIENLQEEIRKKNYKVLGVIPTVSGFHILTNPFRVDKFKEVYPEIDIHRDNPTILYANL